MMEHTPTREELEDMCDNYADKLHDLTIDLREAQRELKEARELAAELQRDQSKLEKELIAQERRAEQAEISGAEKFAGAILTLGETQQKLDTLEKNRSMMLRDLTGKYLRALSIAETLLSGNQQWFGTNDGVVFLEWARREFDRITDQAVVKGDYDAITRG